MFPEPTELFLIGCSIESIWTPKSKSNTLTPKTNSQKIPTKGNFTRDEWNHLLCWFNISHFSLTDCSEVMSKRTQKDSGEERVTARSKQIMSLIARAPSTLSSWASESAVKRRYESQSPLGMQAEKYDRTGKPAVGRDTSHEHRHHHRFVESTHSASYSEWDADKAWSSQEWKSDELMADRTGLPVVFAQHTDRFIVDDDDVDSNTVTESDLSFKSRSFLHRVNDQVRKRQNQSSKDATKDSDKHSVIWGMFMSSTLQAYVFMVKNYSDNLHSIKNTEDLTMKQMFDISAKLVSEQDEIYSSENN